jgi:hypothetical protein
MYSVLYEVLGEKTKVGGKPEGDKGTREATKPESRG